MLKYAATILLAGIAVTAAMPASAKCLNKAAVATAGSENTAKWFALETMVQAVSWGIWPSFVANGSTPGYRITRQRYKCDNSGGAVTCRGQATFCPTTKS